MDKLDKNVKEKRNSGLLKSSLLVSFYTGLSRIAGLLRDIVFARFIGAEALADVFFVAFKIPNFFRRIFAEGAFSQAFVPVLGEYRENRSKNEIKSFIGKVSGTLAMTLGLFTLIFILAIPIFSAIFAPSWYLNNPDKFDALTSMLRITFPYLFFISLTGLAGAVLQSYDKFAVPAATPIILNISLITAAICLSPFFDFPVFALAWGVLIAGVIQLCFQLPFLYRAELLVYPSVDWKDSGVKKILKLMAPAIFGVSVSQINLLLDTILATFLPTGSVSWLYYSDRITELPLGIFAIAIAVVILPNLSRMHASSSTKSFSQTLDWAIRMVFLIALPATSALLILSEPILMTLFYYGEVMTPMDMRMASYSLLAYALGLLGFMLIKILAPGFFARQDMVTPVKVGIIAMTSNMFLNLMLVFPLFYMFGMGHVGLALATSLSAFLNAGLLFYFLIKKKYYTPSDGWFRFFMQVTLALVSMIAMVIIASEHVGIFNRDFWLSTTAWNRGSRILLISLLGFFAYSVSLYCFGFRKIDLSAPNKRVSSR